MGQDEESKELQQTQNDPVLPHSETNSMVDEDASQDPSIGPTSKRKREDLEAPTSELDEGKEAVLKEDPSIGPTSKRKREDLEAPTSELDEGKEAVLKEITAPVETKDEEGKQGESNNNGFSAKQSSGTENGNGDHPIAEQYGEEKGKETEAMETQRTEAQEAGDQKRGTDRSFDGKSEEEDNAGATDAAAPSPKRGKRKSVANTAAKHQKSPGKPPRDPERVELLKKMNTVEDMKKLVAQHGKSEAEYKVGDIIKVDDLMQTNYDYKLEAPMGENFAEGFSPAFNPQQMLAYGIFEGKVINDCIFELPKEWFEEAMEKGTLSPEGPDDTKNYFNVKSRLPSKQWRKRGWYPKEDPHGWFQWYCRYYLGRRLEPDDAHQISRWRQLRRHAGQIKKNCQPGDLASRVKQRQTLLNWSHDCFM
ncbi:unnamed protein product [Calypogeia fissa]